MQAVVAATKSIAAAVPALDTWRGENDAYAVATPGGIKFAQLQIHIGLEVAKMQLANQGEQGKTALASLGMYDSLIEAMDKELSHCAVGLRMADDGAVHVVSRTLPVEGGALAKAASQAKPAKVSPLAGLPQSPFFVAGGGVFTAASMSSWMEMSFGMMRSYPGGDKLSDADIKKLSEISLKSMRVARMAPLASIRPLPLSLFRMTSRNRTGMDCASAMSDILVGPWPRRLASSKTARSAYWFFFGVIGVMHRPSPARPNAVICRLNKSRN